MYTKYSCYPPPRRLVFTAPSSFPSGGKANIDNTKPGAVPESVRTSKWICSTATVCVPSLQEYTSSCIVTTGPTKLSVPVPVGTSPPVVTVQNIAASVTTSQRVSEMLARESDPYNPNTRFAAYFPPAPLPYICPERIPNNLPKGSTADCVPIRRFQGSAEAAGLVSSSN